MAASTSTPFRYVVSDPYIYYDRVAEMMAGRLPYLDAAFEHLPVMIIPMAATWVLGGSADPFTYHTIWATLSAVALVGTLLRLYHLEDSGLERVAARWLAIAAPLIPLVLYRNESWVVLPAVWAMGSLAQHRPGRAAVATALGALAKLWPIGLVPIIAWGRHRWWAMAAAAVSVGGLLAVVTLPGFREGRLFEGLHSETLGAGLWSVSRYLVGTHPRLLDAAGATYVDAPQVLAIAGLMIGAVIGVRALMALAGSFSLRGAMLVLGSLVIALLLASPLQSTQFLYWMTPFAASSGNRRVWAGAAIANLLGILGLIFFDAVRSGAWQWHAATFLRNVLLVAIGWLLASEARRVAKFPDSQGDPEPGR